MSVVHHYTLPRAERIFGHLQGLGLPTGPAVNFMSFHIQYKNNPNLTKEVMIVYVTSESIDCKVVQIKSASETSRSLVREPYKIRLYKREGGIVSDLQEGDNKLNFLLITFEGSFTSSFKDKRS